MAYKIMRRKTILLCVILITHCLADSTLETNRKSNSDVAKQSSSDNKDVRISDRSSSNSYESNNRKSLTVSTTTESPSFMSRVASWIFPFGKDSQAESTGPVPQHVVAPRIYHNHDHQQENCNPCNEVPWIPLNNQPAKQTVIEFVPPHQNNFGGHGNLDGQTQVITAGGILPPPADNYGVPPPPSGVDNVEIISTHFNPPKDTYGPPFQNIPLDQNNYHPPKDTYGSPAQNVPLVQNNLEIQNNYGPPPADTYGPPQPLPDPIIHVNHDNSAGSLDNTYGVPNSNYNRPPADSGHYQPLKQAYRPPKSAHISSSHNRPLSPAPNVIHGSSNVSPTPLKLSSIHGGSQSLSVSYGLPYQKPGSHYSVPLKLISQSNKPTILSSHSQKFNGQSSYKLQSLPSQKPSIPFNSGYSGANRKPNVLYAPQYIGDYLGPPASGHGINIQGTSSLKLSRPPSKNPYTQIKNNLGPSIKYGTPLVYGGFSASHFGSSISNSNKYIPPTNSGQLKYIPVQQSILAPPPHHNAAHFSIPPTNAYHLAPSVDNHLVVSTQLSKPQNPLPTQDTTKPVTPTSEEYRPPPQQLPISTNQAEIPQETSIVHIPIYDNSAQFLQPPLAPIPFPELNPGPIPPIHHAQPFYTDLPQQHGDHNDNQNQQITTIEIHESENGNLQYLTNIPNPSKLNPPPGVHGNSGNVDHNHNLIKHVINALPEKVNTQEPDVTSHNHLHQDTSISETKHSALQHIEDSILVPPPQTLILHNNEVLPSHNIYHANNIQQQHIPSQNIPQQHTPQNILPPHQHSQQNILPPHQHSQQNILPPHQHSSQNILPPQQHTPQNILPPRHHPQPNSPQQFNSHVFNYNNNFARPQNSHIFNNDALTTEVKVVKSIPIAEFTSSIEYPATLSQAPIVDIIAEKDVDPNTDDNDEKIKQNEITVSKDAHGGMFSKNPIVVDEDNGVNEPHSAASSHNISVQANNYLEHNDQNYEESDHEDGLKSTRDTQGEISPSVNHNQHPNHNYEIISSEEIQNELKTKSAKEFNFSNVDNQTQFTPPTIDYSSWLPSSGPISTSMVPPAPNAGGIWVTPEPTETIPETVPEGMKPPPPPSSSQNPKKIQIIIPYTSNSHPTPFQQAGDISQLNANWIQEQQAFLNGQVKMPENTDPGIFMTPPSDVPLLWLTNTQNGILPNDNQFIVGKQNGIDDSVSVPFDILRLQQNIDEWTIQEYADQIQHSSNQQDTIKASTIGHLSPSKKIPNEYLTTTAVTNDLNSDVASTEVPKFNFGSKLYFDHEPAGSIQHSVHTNLHNVTVIGDLNNTLFESNLIVSDPVFSQTTTEESSESTVTDETTKETILPETTWETTTDTSFYDEDIDEEVNSKTSSTTPIWEKGQISKSPVTGERIYVVTPQPWNPNESTPKSAWIHAKNATTNEIADDDNFNFVSPRFVVRPTPATSIKKANDIKIIYSEWPQSINNLETTTKSTSTTARSTKSDREKNRTPSLYKALWGLMDLTPYTPPPDGIVETNAGHSKVVTQVTQSSLIRTTERPHNSSTTTQSSSDSLLDFFD